MTHPDRDEARSRGVSRDMSPGAIERRLDIVSHLREVCLWLGTARKVEKDPESRPHDSPELSKE